MAAAAAISVLTHAARGHYLDATIASLDRGGAADFEGPKIIHVDGPADGLGRQFAGWTAAGVWPWPGGGGARHAMLSVMRWAARAGIDLLLYFEDDVLVCRNAIRAMLEIGVPEPLGLVSYCDLAWDGAAGELRALPGCPRDRPVAVGGFVGCQALAIPARTLRTFATWTPPDWLARDRNNCDGTIGQIAPAYGIFASLAQHVGRTSAIVGRRYADETFRATKGWVGEDFEADTVPRRWTLNELGTRCSFHAGVLHADGRTCPRLG